MIADTMQLPSGYMKRCTVISIFTCNRCAHKTERLHDSFHGTFLDGGISIQCTIERLCRQDSGNKPCGGTAVAGIQNSGRFMQTPKTFSVDDHTKIFRRVYFCFNAHLSEAADRREAVCSVQKMMNDG